MKKAINLAAAVLVLVAGVRVSGQSYRSFQEEYDAIREQAKLRLGPLRIKPVFRVSDVGYDSNVYFREDGGEAIPDYTATFSLQAWAHWLVGSSAILSVMDNPEYQFYARETPLRTLTNSFAADFRLFLLRRFSLAAEYHALSHVRRVTSELDRKIQDTATGGTARLYFETPRGTAIGLTGAVDDFRFDDVASDTPDDIYSRALDRRETSAAFELYYRVFSRSYFFATAGWTRIAFVFPESAWRDASSLEVSGGFRLPLVGWAKGQVLLGWKAFQPQSPAQRRFSGLIAATDVSFRLGWLGLTLGYDRDNVFSYSESAYYFIDSRARAGASVYVASFLRIDGGVRYGTMVYPDPQVVWDNGAPVVIVRREDIERIISGGLVIRVAGTIGLGLTYNFYKRTSNAPGFNIRRNFVGAFITYEF